MREDRQNNEIRKIKITPDIIDNADGSVLIECGNTKVICSAKIENKVPFFLKGRQTGWISAEYSMLPASTINRKLRDISRGKLDGRSAEIQRLIGRSLRSVIDLDILGEKTIWIDCDVINADGGTRTTSINGAFLALEMAVKKLMDKNELEKNPIISKVAAISVGSVKGVKLCDLDFYEDSNADLDLNIVMDDKLNIIEVQGTGEKRSFSRSELNEFLDIAEIGIKDILKTQEIVERYI